MSLHLRIKEIAKEKGITLKEVYVRMGYTQQNHCRITGRESISLKQLKKIAKILKVDVCRLIV